MGKVLILEDNQHCVRQLESIIAEMDDVSEICCCRSLGEARKSAADGETDIFIVDICLDADHEDDISGLKFVEYIRSKNVYRFSPVIIITAYASSKLYAYDRLHCYRYLEKPFQNREVKEVVMESLEMAKRYDKDEIIHFENRDKVVDIRVRDIIYIECGNRKITIKSIYGEDEFYYKTMSDFKKDIFSKGFFQCSRNVIVNQTYINMIDFKNNRIVLAMGYGEIRLGRTYKKMIRENYLKNEEN